MNVSNERNKKKRLFVDSREPRVYDRFFSFFLLMGRKKENQSDVPNNDDDLYTVTSFVLLSFDVSSFYNSHFHNA